MIYEKVDVADSGPGLFRTATNAELFFFCKLHASTSKKPSYLLVILLCLNPTNTVLKKFFPAAGFFGSPAKKIHFWTSSKIDVLYLNRREILRWFQKCILLNYFLSMHDFKYSNLSELAENGPLASQSQRGIFHLFTFYGIWRQISW